MKFKIRISPSNHSFLGHKYLVHRLILGLDFYHRFRIGAERDKDGNLFLHKNGKLIVFARPSNSIPNI